MSDSTGVGFVGLLTVLFIGLKLTGYINWPWFWVLSPVLITTMIWMIILIITVIILIGIYLKSGGEL